MTDIDTLAATIRAGIDRLLETADRRRSELWWVGKVARIVVYDHGGARVGDITLHGDPNPGDVRTVSVTEAIQRGLLAGSPTTLEQQAARDRRLLDLLLAEKHGLVDADDPYPCPRRGTSAACQCGRDERVAAYLGVLAGAYEETT